MDGEVKVGSRYQGKVLSIKEFGAIVELSDHPSGAMGALHGRWLLCGSIDVHFPKSGSIAPTLPPYMHHARLPEAVYPPNRAATHLGARARAYAEGGGCSERCGATGSDGGGQGPARQHQTVA
jgi:hypothetical protein